MLSVVAPCWMCWQLINVFTSVGSSVVEYLPCHPKVESSRPRLYSQCFIFYVTYELSQKARVLHYAKLKRPASTKQSTLLGLLLSYEEIKVLYDPWDCIHSASFSVTCEWSQKARVLHYARLERLARDKHSTLLGPLISFEEIKVSWVWPLGLYSQCFIFYLTYELSQKARVLHYARLKRPARTKQFTLLEPLISYKTIEELWVWPRGLYSQCFIFYVTNEWPQQARVLNYASLERLVRDKPSSLLGPSLRYEENEVLSRGTIATKIALKS